MFTPVIGVVLLLLGASAATVLHRTYARRLDLRLTILTFACAGALIGFGAALARGYALMPTTVAAAVLVPIVAVLSAARTARKHGPRSQLGLPATTELVAGGVPATCVHIFGCHKGGRDGQRDHP